MRVLVVEDAWRLAEAVAEILRGEGWSADVATDGGRGAELAAAGAYDCVLLDLMLPVMGGLDVLRGMREAGDATPVILVTARDAVPDRVGARHRHGGRRAPGERGLARGLLERRVGLRGIPARRPEPRAGQ